MLDVKETKHELESLLSGGEGWLDGWLDGLMDGWRCSGAWLCGCPEHRAHCAGHTTRSFVIPGGRRKPKCDWLPGVLQPHPTGPSPAANPCCSCSRAWAAPQATYPSVNTAGRHGCRAAGTRHWHLIPGEGAFVRDSRWQGWFGGGGIATWQQYTQDLCSYRGLITQQQRQRQTPAALTRPRHRRQQLECSSQTGYAPRGLC